MPLGLPQEIGQQLMAGLREHTFGMELHALQVRVVPVSYTHLTLPTSDLV